jgi:Xaa-Pro aminopeptidase
MSVTDKIKALRKCMEQEGIDIYIVPTADFHASEYVGGYFKTREYITGFTGSAGTAVILKNSAKLFTDGRYFIQAEEEIKGSEIELVKMGQANIPTLIEFIVCSSSMGDIIGFDERVMNASFVIELKEKLAIKSANICGDKDLFKEIWKERPEISAKPAYILDMCYAGCQATDKLKELRNFMINEGGDKHILTSLPDINWLLNIRGNDIEYNPMILSYMIIGRKEAILFINKKSLSNTIITYLSDIGITIKAYDEFYNELNKIKNSNILLDKMRVNYGVYNRLDNSNNLIEKTNKTLLAKAIKNPIEIENIKRAHIKDGVAVTKFIYWLKQNIGKITISESSAAKQLLLFRKEQKGFIELSFETISAYAVNAAICHYSVSESTNLKLNPEGLFLMDSGGHYYEGTTDITRTIVLGELTEEMKKHYTLVLAGMLRLGNARFVHGVTGNNLDYIAREALWKYSLDYNHGTGHGIGYLLGVHEFPNNIHWKGKSVAFEEGMIVSDEPALYVEGQYGIRIENAMLCKEIERNSYGKFMGFEFLTYVPIDLEAINSEYLDKSDIYKLNCYHKAVYDNISPYLNEEEKQWLGEVTKDYCKNE